MAWIVKNLWLIPALPILAAGLTALAPRRCRKFSSSLAIGSLIGAFLLSLCALARALQIGPDGPKDFCNVPWLQFAAGDAGLLKLGWVLDPLTAVMLVMVTFVGLLIFIYSVGYMAHDENFTRFFTFLSLFAGAMLGVVIANSLLLLFISWELVGLTSYLLIGFWYHKPAAAAAAKKAFITTRVGDVFFFLGMMWLYHETGTLLFYDDGAGCMEQSAIAAMIGKATAMGMTVSAAVGLLIFAGAVGKSGQVPLHVWLPDAMEGPTPVSALIHAATMVAAGVFLVARVIPLMSPAGSGLGDGVVFSTTAVPMQVITWIGAITAVFAASIAVAQNDIKRILAYSTVSQLGYMMMGLGVGGVAVGMFHLITHAFFKALLFLGAGSVIHGCHDEQDIRHLGGIKRHMPITFATYAVGMLALAGFPLVFSGFWSKDAILHSAHGWSVSHVPFYLGVAGAFLTAFYMTRQVALVFFGKNRALHSVRTSSISSHSSAKIGDSVERVPANPHESPFSMTAPLVILATCAIGLSVIGTPAWPWFQTFLGQHHGEGGFTGEVIKLMLISSALVFAGIGLGWWLYGRKPIQKADEPDVLERLPLGMHTWFARKYGIDELYELTVIRFNAWSARACAFLDQWVWGTLVALIAYLMIGLGWVSDTFDRFVINLGFDSGCGGVTLGGKLMSRLQDGRVQNYLRIIGLGLVGLVLFLIWGGAR